MLNPLYRLVRGCLFTRRAKNTYRANEDKLRRVAVPFYSGSDVPPAGFWRERTSAKEPFVLADLTCPFGHTTSLDGYVVAANGFVSPSVECSHENCDFREYVVLAGWKPARVENACDESTLVP